MRQLNEKTGIGGMSMLLIGKRTPPLEKVESLATALGITNREERDHFYILALLAHCPPELEAIFLEQFKRLHRLEQQLAEYDAKVAETGNPDRQALIAHMERQKQEIDQLRAENAALKKAKRH